MDFFKSLPFLLYILFNTTSLVVSCMLVLPDTGQLMYSLLKWCHSITGLSPSSIKLVSSPCKSSWTILCPDCNAAIHKVRLKRWKYLFSTQSIHVWERKRHENTLSFKINVWQQLHGIFWDLFSGSILPLQPTGEKELIMGPIQIHKSLWNTTIRQLTQTALHTPA